MTTTLHLGVIDQPYADGGRAATTGDVAKWLEKRYGLMGAFYGRYQQRIADAVRDSMQDALDTVMLGGPPSPYPFAGSDAAIEDMFKNFLASREAERVGIPGTPTQAALMGVSSRFKRRRGPRRPSFVDSGLFQASFKSWVDGQP